MPVPVVCLCSLLDSIQQRSQGEALCLCCNACTQIHTQKHTPAHTHSYHPGGQAPGALHRHRPRIREWSHVLHLRCGVLLRSVESEHWQLHRGAGAASVCGCTGGRLQPGTGVCVFICVCLCMCVSSAKPYSTCNVCVRVCGVVRCCTCLWRQ